MAGEIVKDTHNYFLVQVDDKGVERGIKIQYNGQPSEVLDANFATEFEDIERAKKLAQQYNMLNAMQFDFGIVDRKVTIYVVERNTTLNFTDKPQNVDETSEEVTE